MKTIIKSNVIILIPLVFLLTANVVSAQPPDYSKFAANIVKNTVQLKPGEEVIISGNKNLIELMEQLAVAVNMAGGHSVILLRSDLVSYNYWHNVPIEFIKNDKKLFWNNFLSSDVMISLPGCYDCNYVYSGISDDKQNLTYNTDEENQKLNQSRIRQYFIQIPEKELAENFGFTESDFASMTWKAIETDYSKISERCRQINDILVKGKKIKISSPDGTDFIADLLGKNALLNDGIVSPDEANSNFFSDRYVTLPTGSVSIIPDESSGSGTIVSIFDVDVDYNPLEKVKGVIKKGQIVEMSAEKGNDFILRYYSTLAINSKQLSGISIGVNPDLTIGTKPKMYYWEAEGMVIISFGGNILSGGTNNSTEGWFFPVVGATVEVDGKVIIKNGKLTL